MGVLYDYFSAPDDAAAAAVIDRDAGPGGTGAWAPSGGGFFGRRRQQQAPAGPAYPTVADTGIDPVVQCGTLEELLTGRPYEDIEVDPRWGQALAIRDEGEQLVLTLTDALVDALARAQADQLASVAVPWSKTKEFWGTGDPAALTSFLIDMSATAKDARTRGETLYCWVCV